MAGQKISFLGSSYNKADLKGSSITKLSNMYLEAMPFPVNDNQRAIATDNYVATMYSLKVGALYTPGTQIWTDLQGSQIRVGGMIVNNNIGYVVKDNKLCQVNPDSTYSILGTIGTTTGAVTMAALNTEIVVADGTGAWSYRIDLNNFQQISGSVPTNCAVVISNSNYFLFLQPGSPQVYVSNPNDGRTVQALSFFSTGINPNNLVTGCVSYANNIVYLLGSYSTETWYNSGGGFVPYDRTASQCIPYGTVAQNSVVEIDGSVYWLATNAYGGIKGICIANGLNYQIVNNEDFAEKVSTYLNVKAAFAWISKIGQHSFYNITFPFSDNGYNGVTHSYDVSNGTWHEKHSFNANKIPFPGQDRHLANASMCLNNIQYVGDSNSAQIFTMEKGIYTENGNDIQRIIQSQFVSEMDKNIVISEIEVDVERSIADVSSILKPTLALETCRDYGNTFTNKLFRQIGPAGNYNIRCLFHGLGASRRPAFRLSMSGPFPWAILGFTGRVR